MRCLADIQGECERVNEDEELVFSEVQIMVWEDNVNTPIYHNTTTSHALDCITDVVEEQATSIWGCIQLSVLGSEERVAIEEDRNLDHTALMPTVLDRFQFSFSLCSMSPLGCTLLLSNLRSTLALDP
ncbi:unnamed protein product [Somion occarium]|uniref:Uncharacterized protein n=1 Tax=Somion occarium TaxID=3059160 RepID=A0ABP1CSE5_9APHY